jgi:heme a synthase
MSKDLPALEMRNRAIRLWLYAVAALIFAMVLVGGATRLTESGLSIVEWKPMTGALPPMGEGAWQAEFDKYKTIPQFQHRNSDMTLAEFKTIFWWEWAHRLMGRLIGAAFLLPFLAFLAKGWIGPGLRARLWGIFGLGALQGGIGWWMVASGLTERVEVSQYRLATHLILACVIFAAMLWTASRLRARARTGAFPGKVDTGFPKGNATNLESRALSGHAACDFMVNLTGKCSNVPQRIRIGAIALLVLVLLQIYLGAVVAGLRAGLIYNTWPLIDGSLIPNAASLLHETPWWRNLFENTLTVQFNHRMLAYAIFVLALLHAGDVARTVRGGPVLAHALALGVAVTLQAALGIVTLLHAVPIALALLHQAMAVIVLSIAVVHAERMSARRNMVPVQVPLAAR